jgi:hypothetical protein
MVEIPEPGKRRRVLTTSDDDGNPTPFAAASRAQQTDYD